MADLAKPAPDRLRHRLETLRPSAILLPALSRLNALRRAAGPRAWIAAALVLTLGAAGAAALLSRRPGSSSGLVAAVRRDALQVRLVETGVLKPSASITYRSPLGGREAEVVFLVPEGTRVGEGDLLVRLETGDLQRELDRAVQEQRQAEVELRTAEAERQDVRAAVEALAGSEGALGLEESHATVTSAERKVDRQRQAYKALEPLLDQGFITREELDRSRYELEQAEAELSLARRKAEVYEASMRPREAQRARLQLAQREAQLGNARARLDDASGRVTALREQIEGCRIHARAPGIVVYEEYLGGGTRRKIRVGDRVTGSQGLVTIPEVQRMVVESSVREADVHRVRAGRPATIRLDAFPDLVLTGRVSRVGTLARSSADRPFDDKRFDMIVDVDAAPAELRPEMTARVDVLVDERKDVLLVPVSAVFDRQGTTVCHRLTTFGTETRVVDLGETDDLSIEVRSGLEEGDRVLLADTEGGLAAPAKPLMRGTQAVEPWLAR